VQHVGRCHEQHLRGSYSTVEVVILEAVVLFRIEHLEQRRCRSPRKSDAILSTSSSMNTGLRVPAFFIDWMICPGSAPM